MSRTFAFLILTSFLSTLCGIYVWASHSPRFNLTQIDVEGNLKISDKDILEKAKMELGNNIFRLDLQEIRDRVREDKRIKDLRVRRKVPDRALIEVEEKKPILWINLPDGLYGLSQGQEIIPLEEEDFDRDLPLVTGLVSPSALGNHKDDLRPYEKWPNAKAKLALHFWNSLLEEDSTFREIISEINLSDQTNLVLYLIPWGTQVALGKGSYGQKLKRVIAILQYEGNSKSIACIDLRFKDQVVLTKSSPGLARYAPQDSDEQLAETERKGSGRKESL